MSATSPDGCRSGAPLGGRGTCREPVVTDAEAEEVGCTPGRWCRRHGTQLARIRRSFGGRPKATPKPPKRPQRRPHNYIDREALAARVAGIVAAGGPVKKAALREATGRNGTALDAAITLAKERGLIRTVFEGPVAQRGYYPAQQP